MRNVKFALRTLFKSPFVTAVAILSLALGIGANAGIFSVFDELLLAPLPVSQPTRLVNFGAPGPQLGSNSCNEAGDCDEIFSYPMFRDLEAANTGFSGIAAHRLIGANIAMAGQTPLSAEVMLASGSYFSVLGLRPAMGRLFGPDDDKVIGAHFIAVLSHEYWATHLGSDRSVLDKMITVNGQQLQIIGVAPEGFTGTTIGSHPDAFIPISMRAALTPGFTAMDKRNSYWVYLFGRLAPGVSMRQADAKINTVYHGLINERDVPLLKGTSAKTLAQFRAKKITLSDGARGQSSLHSQVRTPIYLLFAITGIVLLIACANIANLLLARAANRTTEMALRLSLGATRRQLVVQLLTESVLLGLFGGAAGLFVAHWTLAGMSAMLPADVAVTMDFHLNGAALAFTAIMSVATGVLFGLVPALNSTRPNLVTQLRNSSGRLSGGRSAARFRTSLVTAQIALSMALLIAAGLFIKSLRNISRVDLGVSIDNMVTFGVSPNLSGYDTTRTKALYARMEEDLGALPGVTGVVASMMPLLAGNNWGEGVWVQGFKHEPDVDNGSRFNAVGPGYFHVLGVPILSGREFTAGDVANSQRVAIVNEAFAKKFGLGRDAVGKRMSFDNDSLNVTIVGLVKDAKYSEVKQVVPPVFVIPYRQMNNLGSVNFYVRTALPSSQAISAVRGVMKQLDPNLPIESLETVPQVVKENVFLDRMISTLSAAFACLATLLAAVGLYGVLAYSVAQRTREIGVRMALGANGSRVQAMVLGQVGRMTIVGGVIGIAGALALGHTAQSLLYQLTGYDPIVVLAAAVVLTFVALGAGFLPALRASRIDPMQALRYE